MYILGLSSYSHEASCALLKDGAIRFLVEEERLNREKHTWKYPANAIAQCLASEGITIHDIDHITFFLTPSREIIGNVGHVLKFFPRSLHLMQAPSGAGELAFFERVNLMNDIGKRLAAQFQLPKAPTVHFV